MFFLAMGFVLGGLVWLVSRNWIAGAISFLLTAFISYIFLPVISYGFYGLPWLVVVTGIIILIVAVNDKKDIVLKGAVLIVGILFLTIIPFMATNSIFHASEYRNLIGNVKTGIYSTDTSPVDITQVRQVDQALAARLADKKLGEDMAIGSQVDIGTMNIQQVKGQLYWVAPLNHSGFFKWWSNPKGTPGYIMVSATNERDVRFVQKLKGKSIFLKYNDGNYFSDDLHRYLYDNGYKTKGLTDCTFEIDDDGKPYWVVTVYKPEIGFGGENAVGIVVLDAQTGKITPYSIKNAPKWVDRIQPEGLVVSQLNDWGEFVHGWLNPSGKDKLETTAGTSLVYGKDGNSYWYTGMTSVGSDQSTIGFVLVNTRTKETKLYRQAGATETAAMKSAEGMVQEKGYKATFPILYNVSGVPTYFTTLKDKEGLVKIVAFVSVKDYNIVGIGSTVKKAIRSYRQVLMTKGNNIAPDSTVDRLTAKGKVLRIGREPTSNGCSYYFLIQGYKHMLFFGTMGLSSEIVITKAGDSISVTYDDGGSAIVDMASFDNLDINLQKTANQRVVDARAKAVQTRNSDEMSGQNADAAWGNLTSEQKAKLLKK